jgi:aspartate racemase
MIDAGEHLKKGGISAILLCANSMHAIADQLAPRLQLPIIHIAEVTAAAVKKKALKKVGLIGTRYTMEMDFFKDKLKAENIEVIIPDYTDREYLHDSIHNELAKGRTNEEMKTNYLAIINKLAAKGAEGVVLGCTEIPLLLKPDEIPIPSFDTTSLHAAAAVEFALSDS